MKAHTATLVASYTNLTQAGARESRSPEISGPIKDWLA